jgi:hypothetical protein
MKQSNNTKIRVIACGALAREILAVSKLNELTQIDLDCLPAQWHNNPEKISPGVKAAIKRARTEGFTDIFIAYADCGTGGELDRVCKDENVKRLRGPHCYSFFSGNLEFQNRWDNDMSAFFLTDFLARQFETLIIDTYKLKTHPELVEMMFSNYSKLIYLAQTNDVNLEEKAKDAAKFLGLEYEYRFTGYGDLSKELNELEQ